MMVLSAQETPELSLAVSSSWKSHPQSHHLCYMLVGSSLGRKLITRILATCTGTAALRLDNITWSTTLYRMYHQMCPTVDQDIQETVQFFV